MCRIRRRHSSSMEAATGERIVAFGRAGKSPESAFFRQFCRPFEAGGNARWNSATVFKAGWRRAFVRGISDMALLTTKKRQARKSLHQAGWITLEGGFAARQCVVKDMSATGAKVTIDDPNSLPAKLRLAFSRDARTGRPCEVVWRRGKSVGIKFVR
jgi:PilZ domain-containing protein